MRNVIGIVIGTGVLLTAATAFAQPEPPPPTPPPAQPTPPPPPPPTATATATVTTPVVTEKKEESGDTDHSKVVGHFGVMYFGISQTPIATGNQTGVVAAPPGQGNVSTPVIGARYWFQEKMGIDAGLGFGLGSSGASVKNGSTEVSSDGPAQTAFALHGGLPIAFAQGKHYSFLLVPEVNFAYAWQTVKAQNVAPGAVPEGDHHFNGLRLDIGARVGTEIQFGFIGVPELALQASIGLDFRHLSYHASQDANAPTTVNETSSSLNTNQFGTTVQNDPWAIFVNNISAIYYFP